MAKTTKGIDISTWQQKVDFKKVKAAGYDFVIIRAGFGREISQKDNMFESHYKNAKAAGLAVGAYWYSYADSVADAKKEANACIAVIKGKKFELPIYFDMEENSQTKLGKTTLTKMAKAFCDTVKAAGYKVGVYSNLNWFTNYLDYKELKKLYSIWFAQYHTDHQLDCDIWQNSSTGRVDGYNGNIDTNYCYVDFTTAKSESNTTKPATKNTNVDVTYRVKAGGKWLGEIKNLTDYAGIEGKPITDVAIKVSKGKIKYRVHVCGGGWLGWITDYNIKDAIKGYAGNGKPIDAIQVYYYTPDDIRPYKKAYYKVSPIGKTSYYSWQTDTDKGGDMDGYAGCIGVKIDKLQIQIK